MRKLVMRRTSSSRVIHCVLNKEGIKKTFVFITARLLIIKIWTAHEKINCTLIVLIRLVALFTSNE